ncbi:hypothetical protein DFH06DRAFT_1334041 [Mycena polygramma]|nr:hypothetical protein DFH06DRAFT_1334041 [Mycena polygramma]
MGKTKGKDKASDAPPRKRGNQGDFHGERKEFLNSRLDEYRDRSAKKTTQAWWPNLFKAYWLRFSWRLPLSQEPTEEDDDAAVDGVLTEEEKTAKAKVLTETEAKIKRWFSYRRAPGGGASNPPKRLPDWQVYMQDEQKNDAVNAKFAEDFPHLVGARNTINERGQIARELLGLETSEGDAGFEHPELNEEDRQDARNRLGTTVQPLLDALRAYTGYHLTLLAGTVEDGRFDIRSVHSGKTRAGKDEEGKDFTRWDPAGYKDRVMTQFMRYLAVAEGADASLLGPAVPAAYPILEQIPNPDWRPKPESDSSAGSSPDTDSHPHADSPPSTEDVGPPGTPAPPPGNDMPTGGGEKDAGDSLLGHLTDIGSPLKRAVARLEGQAQLSRIWELERASSFHRIRETNIARNSEALAALGLQQEMRELLKDVEGSKARTKRKSPENAKGGRPKRARREDDDEFGEEQSGREDTPTPRAQTCAQAARTKPPAPAAARAPRATARGRGRGSQAAVTQDGIPKWAAEARETLRTGSGGEKWEKVVELWWTRETAAAFGGPPKGAKPNLRPKEVKGWVARARTGGPSPAIVDVYSFAADWWKCLKKEGEGDWGSAAHTGPNGMLNVLVCLHWWRDVLRGEFGDWEEALADVEWVLNETNGSASRGGIGRGLMRLAAAPWTSAQRFAAHNGAG